MRMRPISLHPIVIATALLCRAAGPLGAQNPPAPPAGAEGAAVPTSTGGILAIIGGDVITYGDLDQKVEEQIALISKKDQPPAEAIDHLRGQLRGRMLDFMIEQSLLLQEAKRLKIEVSEAEIDSQINRLIREWREDGANIRTVEDFYRLLQESRKITREEYREQLRKEILANKLLWGRVFLGREFIPPGERREYYHSHIEEFQTPSELTFRQIYISNRDNTREVLAAIDAALDKGMPFEEAARQFSESLAEEGGLWERKFTELQSWLPPLPDILRRMKPGEIVRKIQTRRGWHYLKLEAIKAGATKPFEEVQEEIEDRILRLRRMEDKDRFIEKLKTRHVVVIDPRFQSEQSARGALLVPKEPRTGAASPAGGAADKVRDVSPSPVKPPAGGEKGADPKDAEKPPR